MNRLHHVLILVADWYLVELQYTYNQWYDNIWSKLLERLLLLIGVRSVAAQRQAREEEVVEHVRLSA
jgi:hypothetical protein